jgi:predicted RNA-binding protein with PUA-like domain
VSAHPQYWVFLADPEDFGWTDLVAKRRAVWDGIRNSRAQNNLRNARPGDLALIYHTAPDKSLMGIASVVSEPYPDPADAARVVVDVQPDRPLARPLTLAELKADEQLKDLSFVRMPRVAVQPVTAAQWQRVLELSATAK